MKEKIPQRSVYVGVDTHKDQHTISILGPEGNIPISRKTVEISKKGFKELRELILNKMDECKANHAKIGIEAASFYHLNIVAGLRPFFDDIMVFNPKLLGKKGRRREIRQKKNDQKDSLNVAMALRDGIKGSWPYENTEMLELQELHRFKSRLIKIRSNLKKRFRRNMHVLFPGYDKTVNLFGDPSMRLLKHYSTAESIRKAGFEKLRKASQKKGKRGMRTKTLDMIIELAGKVPECPYYKEALVIEHEMLVMLIMRLERWTTKLEEEFMRRWRRMKIKPKFFQIEGLKEKDGAALYAEVGDPRKFPTVDAFVAFHGLDPRTRRSDKKVTYGRITKMGTRFARETLGNVVVVMRKTNSTIRDLWSRSKARGRRYNECRVICMRKLVRIIWGIEKNSMR